jgi:2-keto-4-pentenoate hydratase
MNHVGRDFTAVTYSEGPMRTEAIATELLAALDGSRIIDTITARDSRFDAAAAYSVSAEILRRRRARGETPIGRKIGFTNRGIWAEYGVSAPMWAHVYDSTVTYFDEPAGRIAVGHLVQPRLEPEIVLHFASTPSPTADEAELLSYVDWIAHGFEIVQSHFREWKFQLPDTIAAFGLHGALVVGPRRPVADLGDVDRTLRTFTIALTDGHVKAHGAGSNVLGSPIAAARHLLQVLNGQHQFEPVQAGEIVTTGTLLPPPSIRGGETWRTEVSGIDLPGLCLHVE